MVERTLTIKRMGGETMENAGVKCDVCECVHYCDCCRCGLSSIEVTHQKTSTDAVATPHFCKSFEKK